MKSHLPKLSLALLSAAFLLGCQEQGSEPVGPEGLGPEFAKVKNCDPDQGEVHPSCKTGGDDVGGGRAATVKLGGVGSPDGIVSDGPQDAWIANDGARQLKVSLNATRPGDKFFAKLNLKPSNTVFSPGGACRCEGDATGDCTGLDVFFDKDIGAAENDFASDPDLEISFNFEISRKPTGGGFKVSWVEPAATELGKIHVALRGDEEFGELTVTEEVGLEAGLQFDQTRLTFSGTAGPGGLVRVSRGLPKRTLKERDQLICPYDGPDVVLLLDRSP